MHTQNDALEKVTPLNKWQCLVSMLDFWSVPFLAMGFTLLVSLAFPLPILGFSEPWILLFFVDDFFDGIRSHSKAP